MLNAIDYKFWAILRVVAVVGANLEPLGGSQSTVFRTLHEDEMHLIIYRVCKV